MHVPGILSATISMIRFCVIAAVASVVEPAGISILEATRYTSNPGFNKLQTMACSFICEVNGRVKKKPMD